MRRRSLFVPLLVAVVAFGGCDTQDTRTVAPSGMAGTSGHAPPPAGASPASSSSPASTAPAAEQPSLLQLNPNDVIAKVNGEDVLQSDFARSFFHQRRALGMHKGELADEMARVFERPAYDQLLKRTLLAQEAKKRGFFPDAAQQTGLLDAFVKRLPKDKTLDDVLQAQNESKAGFVKELARDAAIGKLIEDERKKVTLSRDDAKKLFDERKLNETTVMKLQRIVLRPDASRKETPDQLKTRAEAVRQRVLGKDEAAFAKVAGEVSDDATSKAKGGDIGWRSQRQLLPADVEVVMKTQPGEVSNVILSEMGASVYRVNERKVQKVKFADVEKKFVGAELQARGREAMDKLLNELRDTGNIVILTPPRPPLAPKPLQGAKHPEIPKDGKLPKPSADNVLPGMKNPHGSSSTGLALPGQQTPPPEKKDPSRLKLPGSK